MLTGRIVRLGRAPGSGPGAVVKRLVARSGEPVIRQALRQAVRILGDQFVLGRTIESAIANAWAYEQQGYTVSYDMLGEAARTERDAARYRERYAIAIEAVGGPQRVGAERPGTGATRGSGLRSMRASSPR